MRIVIIYDTTFILNNIDKTTTIKNLKSMIEDNKYIPVKAQSLYYRGKELMEDKTVSEYNITNNSFVLLTTKINGGVSGFPDVGHLIILLGISTMGLLIFYYIFYNLMNIVDTIDMQKFCPSLETVESNLNKEPISDILDKYNQLKSKTIESKTLLSKTQKSKILKKGGNINLYYKDLLYTLSSMFYSSVVVIIMTIYAYTMFCNEKLSNWLVVACLASFVVVFLFFYTLYQLIKKNYLNMTPTYATQIMTIIFSIISIILLALTWILPAATHTDYMHWTTYLYPLGVIITVALQYYIAKYTQWGMFIKVLTLFLIASFFVFLPYTMAYVYNIYHMCK